MAIYFPIRNLTSVRSKFIITSIDIRSYFNWFFKIWLRISFIESVTDKFIVLSNIHFVSLPSLYPIKVFIFKRPVKKTLKLTVAQPRRILKHHKNWFFIHYYQAYQTVGTLLNNEWGTIYQKCIRGISILYFCEKLPLTLFYPALVKQRKHKCCAGGKFRHNLKIITWFTRLVQLRSFVSHVYDPEWPLLCSPQLNYFKI